MLDQVTDQLLGPAIPDQGPDRHFYGERLAALAGALTPHAALATLSGETPRMAKIGQGIQAFVRLQPDIAASTAVAAVRTAFGHKFFAPETGAARSTIPGHDSYGHFIDELHLCLWSLEDFLLSTKKPRTATGLFSNRCRIQHRL